jgi:hypothetical protein
VATWCMGNDDGEEGGDKYGEAENVAGGTKEDVQMLKALAREKTKTSLIARKLKRTERATYQKALALGVTLPGGRKKKKGA